METRPRQARQGLVGHIRILKFFLGALRISAKCTVAATWGRDGREHNSGSTIVPGQQRLQLLGLRW